MAAQGNFDAALDIGPERNVIAFDTAFNVIALLFVRAAPVLVTSNIGISRHAKNVHCALGHDRGAAM